MVPARPVQIHIATRPARQVRRRALAPAAFAGIAMALSGVLFSHHQWLVWNRTRSAPLGLYRLSGAPINPGRWVAVSADSDAAQWASHRGYTGPGWPLLKRVAAASGAEICRDNLDIFIDGQHVATALASDNLGRDMPVWRGCVTLQDGDFFLLNAHPRSLDGRYFGVTKSEDVDGVAVPLILLSD